jgi:rhodanese-related sulfurtransferase
MDKLEFETLTAEEFDAYLKNHQEKDYLLIDVRQESEYELGHLAGAKLCPWRRLKPGIRFWPLPRQKKTTCGPWPARLKNVANIEYGYIYE